MFKIVLVSLGVIMIFLLTVNNRHTKRWHVVVVTLAIFIHFSLSGTIVAKPGIVETIPFPMGEIVPKLTDGHTKIGELEAQKMVNVLGPINGGGINVNKFGVKYINESFAGLSSGFNGFELEGKSITNPCSDKRTDDRTANPDYCDFPRTKLHLWLLVVGSWIVGGIIAWLIIPPIFRFFLT